MKGGVISKINPQASGIDIGSEHIFVGIEDEEVISFSTFTSSYLKAIEYLKENNITTVAMEATGVYWYTLYDLIEAAGIKVQLVSGREVRNIPGRKSDVADSLWIQGLHSFGLLHACFIPDETTRELRTYCRLRQNFLNAATREIQHMQKAFDCMNVKLHNVISELTGASGMRIIKSILSGERNPEKLALLCESSILKKKKELIIDSLEGNYRRDYLFILRQAVDGYEYYQMKMNECDKEIQILLESITNKMEPPTETRKTKRIRHNAPRIDNLGEHLMKITGGKDPSRITGLTDKTLLGVLAETGTDFSHWPTYKHFTSWLCLSPGKSQSGKNAKINKKKKKGHTIAGQYFRQAAYSLIRSKNSILGAFYRRMKARKGVKIALKATARKIAVLFYLIMTKGIDYVEQGMEVYEAKIKAQRLRNLEKQAKHFGLSLIPANP